MPIYEFRCNSCNRKTSIFQRSYSTASTPSCPSCGSSDMARCISKFAYHRSAADIMEDAGDPYMADKNPDYYKDPRVIGRWAEKKLGDMGVDINTDESFKGVRDTIAAAREGELPPALKDI